jgi:hypothetical protein
MGPSITNEPTLDAQPTFAEALEQVYVEKFTGAMLLHFAQGVPQELQPLVPTTRIRLRRQKVVDKPDRRARN